ncbi:hypothetical protein [Catellatospora sichuanensis]|uniref:hypothetical protein n=1 Tax=Catellatospora sichuanensis TaxID=1969805 RepID=UPI0011830AF1|nr:hypothetical protein [Catellatospora sichuanensis]
MSEPPPRFLAARLLIAAQLASVTLYTLGAAVPYLILFTFHGTTHCSELTGCQAPGDVLPGPLLWLAVPAILIAMIGPPLAVLSLLMSFTSLARRRRQMSERLRRWMYIAGGITVVFIAFTLTPPGRLLLNWILD